MGEYLTPPDGSNQQFKIGTCEDFRYVTQPEARRLFDAGWQYDAWDWVFNPKPGDPGAIFRFVYSNEDQGRSVDQIISGERSMFHTQRITVPEDFDPQHQDYWTRIAWGKSSESVGGGGFNMKIPCPHSKGFRELGIQTSVDGVGKQHLNIIGQRMQPGAGSDGHLYTIFSCCYCEQWFSLDSSDCERLAAHVRGLDKPEHINGFYCQIADQFAPKDMDPVNA